MCACVFRARPTTRDCFTQAWMQDSYLMKLRRQTLTFTSGRLKEFLVEQQCRRTEGATKHKVLLRTYQSSPQSPASGTAPHVPSPKWGGKCSTTREFAGLDLPTVKRNNNFWLLISSVNQRCMENVSPAYRGTGWGTGDGQTAGYGSNIQRKDRSPRVVWGDFNIQH